jgi:hypothetical protein
VLFVLGTPSASGDAIVMALHAVDALAGLRENELLDTFVARSTGEATRVVRVVTRRDRFVVDLELADGANVGTLWAHRAPVVQKTESHIDLELSGTGVKIVSREKE